ncbi:MAG: hypothetical protein ABIG95_01550 [Candidatus Woesearchaeota archaeon]
MSQQVQAIVSQFTARVSRDSKAAVEFLHKEINNVRNALKGLAEQEMRLHSALKKEAEVKKIRDDVDKLIKGGKDFPQDVQDKLREAERMATEAVKLYNELNGMLNGLQIRDFQETKTLRDKVLPGLDGELAALQNFIATFETWSKNPALVSLDQLETQIDNIIQAHSRLGQYIGWHSILAGRKRKILAKINEVETAIPELEAAVTKITGTAVAAASAAASSGTSGSVSASKGRGKT